MREENFVCTSCGEEFPISQRLEFEDQELCPHCLNEETMICSVCGERLWNDDNAGNEDRPLCQPCYDRYYTSCIRCGALLREEDARYAEDDEDEEEPLCESCYARTTRVKTIQDYYYKPEPIFYGTGNRFFGVEVEIDDGGERDSSARAILEVANGGGLEHLYCKHDGSLNEGFELVTHPMTLAYHQEETPWAGILHKAVELGYKSHQAGTCGLHVHVPLVAQRASRTPVLPASCTSLRNTGRSY